MSKRFTNAWHIFHEDCQWLVIALTAVIAHNSWMIQLLQHVHFHQQRLQHLAVVNKTFVDSRLRPLCASTIAYICNKTATEDEDPATLMFCNNTNTESEIYYKLTVTNFSVLRHILHKLIWSKYSQTITKRYKCFIFLVTCQPVCYNRGQQTFKKALPCWHGTTLTARTLPEFLSWHL